MTSQTDADTQSPKPNPKYLSSRVSQNSQQQGLLQEAGGGDASCEKLDFEGADEISQALSRMRRDSKQADPHPVRPRADDVREAIDVEGELLLYLGVRNLFTSSQFLIGRLTQPRHHPQLPITHCTYRT